MKKLVLRSEGTGQEDWRAVGKTVTDRFIYFLRVNGLVLWALI